MLADLQKQREACETWFARHGGTVKASGNYKRRILEIAGALKVLVQQDIHRLPPPPPPPPPPRSERLSNWLLLARKRSHTARHVVKLISRVGRHEMTAWGQLKACGEPLFILPFPSLPPPTHTHLYLYLHLLGAEQEHSSRNRCASHIHSPPLQAVALMVPEASRLPISPAWLNRVADSLKVDLQKLPPSECHALLPALIALARAPVRPRVRKDAAAGFSQRPMALTSGLNLSGPQLSDAPLTSREPHESPGCLVGRPRT